MAAENGSFNPYLRHPNKNEDGSWDYSFGLNSRYHWPMIKKIIAKQVSIKEIAEYHWNIYNQAGKTSCGVKKFCGYNVRNSAKIKNLFN